MRTSGHHRIVASEPDLANRLALGYFVVPGTKVAKAPHAGIEARLHAERRECWCGERMRFCHRSVKDRSKKKRLRLVPSRPAARPPRLRKPLWPPLRDSPGREALWKV